MFFISLLNLICHSKSETIYKFEVSIAKYYNLAFLYAEEEKVQITEHYETRH